MYGMFYVAGLNRQKKIKLPWLLLKHKNIDIIFYLSALHNLLSINGELSSLLLWKIFIYFLVHIIKWGKKLYKLIIFPRNNILNFLEQSQISDINTLSKYYFKIVSEELLSWINIYSTGRVFGLGKEKFSKKNFIFFNFPPKITSRQRKKNEKQFP